jgi:hypothetical protein
MIRVKVEVSPGLRGLGGERSFVMILPDGATVKTALMRIGYRGDEVDHLRVSVAGISVPIARGLKDGDDIFVWAPISGG